MNEAFLGRVVGTQLVEHSWSQLVEEDDKYIKKTFYPIFYPDSNFLDFFILVMGSETNC